MSAMHAAVFCGNGRSEIRRQPLPQPASGEVCVRLEGCGVCASNLPVWSGRPWFRYPLAPGTPGHEGWGEITAIGDGVEDCAIGERVALLSAHAYAEYDVAPVAALARLPQRCAGLPLPGEALACAMNIFRRSRVRGGQRVAIVGVGFLGVLLTELAAGAGAEVIAITRRAYALELARSFGAKHLVRSDDVQAAIGTLRELTGGAGCERVIEATGEQAALDLASAIVAEGGRLVIAGYHQDGPRTVDMQQWNWRGIDVINAHERDGAVVARGLREAMQAVEDGRLNPFPLLTHRFALDRLDDAFELLGRRPDGFMKAVVTL